MRFHNYKAFTWFILYSEKHAKVSKIVRHYLCKTYFQSMWQG